MNELPLFVLKQILLFLSYHEIRSLMILNRQFRKGCQEITQVKPPSSTFIEMLVDDFNKFEDIDKKKQPPEVVQRMEISGCEILSLDCVEDYKDREERFDTLLPEMQRSDAFLQPPLHTCLLTCLKSENPEGIKSWGENVIVEIKTYWAPKEAPYNKFITGKVIKSDGDRFEILTVPFEFQVTDYFEYQIQLEFERQQNKSFDIEGVLYFDDPIGVELRTSLMENINQLAARQVPDYHPGSGNIVRDILHPALYCFVNGVSEFIPSNDLPEIPKLPSQIPTLSSPFRQVLGRPNVPTDQWGHPLRPDVLTDQWERPYEASRFQWLPTYIDFDQWGHCRYRNDINNLPRDQNETLYKNLESLFQLCVPHFEAVLGYGKLLSPDAENEEMRFVTYQDYDVYEVDTSNFLKTAPKPYELVGKSLQVITKIVDYELQPQQTYEGVWHVEGMSHENIVATADFILDRDEDVVGGDILFKRAILRGEAGYLYETGQERLEGVDDIVNAGLVPLGRVATPRNRLVVFPNSHVHKVTKMENIGKTDVCRRRIVVFFLVNPEVRIVSTQEVPRQTETITRDDAMKFRLELMEERKYHKQDWNIREINLCEH